MSFNARKLYELLPAIHRIRDAERGEPLAALLAVVADEIAVLEEDLQQLYDDQFIETCAPWVVPYIGDLIGYRSLHGVVPKLVNARSEVAHTIGFRRRKGTAAMLEQLARDVTQWKARVVEFFELLGATQYMNHVRRHSRFAPDLRQWEPLERLGTAFETTAHTVDVRSITGGEGKYNIPNIGIFLWRLDEYSLTNSPAAKLIDDSVDRRFLFSPLGNNTQLFTNSETEVEISHLAEPINVPDTISRRVLAANLSAYYGPQKSLSIRVDGQAVPLDKIAVCNLADLTTGDWAHPSQNDKVTIDPVLGRIVLGNTFTSQDVRVTFHYGFSADIGGGEYDREETFESALLRESITIRVPDDEPTIDLALQSLSNKNGIVEITDSGRHALTGPIRVAANQKLELRAKNKCRPLVTMSADLEITGEADSAIFLNGLLIAGGGVLLPSANNQLNRLRLTHCTLVPGVGLKLDGEPQSAGATSLTAAAPNVQLELDHCIVGSLRVSRQTHVAINDSIIDATDNAALAYADENGTKPGGPLNVVATTIIGRVHTVALELASNTIFHAQSAAGPPLAEPVLSEKQQTGCVRFSYVPVGSRVPRRFRCQPDLAVENALAAAKKSKLNPLSPLEQKLIVTQVRARMKPSFTALRYGQPGFAQLRTSTPVEIRTGADDESEIGAFHHLFQPQRETNLRVRLDEYLRVGLAAGVFYAS